MTLAEAEELKAGDEVYWADPDADACSRLITIKYVEIKGDVVHLVDDQESSVEVFAHELSFVN